MRIIPNQGGNSRGDMGPGPEDDSILVLVEYMIKSRNHEFAGLRRPAMDSTFIYFMYRKGGQPKIGKECTEPFVISIHVPARGTTRRVAQHHKHNRISIHVPARGTTG